MRARAALLAAAGLLLAGCGIPTTGVVEAGEPAAGAHGVVTLYFVSALDGSLVTLQRQVDSDVGPAYAVGRLFNGLPPAEADKFGVGTDLPRAGAPTVHTKGGTMTVDLSSLAGPLSTTALAQVVCTALAAGQEPTADPNRVTVRIDGVPTPRARIPTSCEAEPARLSGSAPATAPPVPPGSAAATAPPVPPGSAAPR